MHVAKLLIRSGIHACTRAWSCSILVITLDDQCKVCTTPKHCYISLIPRLSLSFSHFFAHMNIIYEKSKERVRFFAYDIHVWKSEKRSCRGSARAWEWGYSYIGWIACKGHRGFLHDSARLRMLCRRFFYSLSDNRISETSTIVLGGTFQHIHEIVEGFKHCLDMKDLK